ncbi:dihydropteroate synthase [Paenirhodobacter sp.]|uniref:dihydropteroate synthase n=1 Tax=Paenirhodobacter sp. TaxID=1965326 RepID=UPI003B3EB693
MKLYFRPITQSDPARPEGALPLAGGWCWFDAVEVLSHDGPQGRIAARDLPAEVRERLTAPRADLAGLDFAAPRIMGILNLTPDSFSDGGNYVELPAALDQARAMMADGADILDLGGESTRPGAVEIPVAEEIARTAPAIIALRAEGAAIPISIDTRKAGVARAAVMAGAGVVNDVSAMEFDPDMAGVVAGVRAGLCLMHAQGDPATMQADPRYGNVLLEVYDYLEARIRVAARSGIPRARIMVDPGIGFGKTVAHNLTLLRGLSLFHGLGCPILLGVSRKRFIGSVGRAMLPAQRMPGTLAVTLAGVAQGVQVHRVHDVAEVAQGLRLWEAIRKGQA